MLGEEFAAVYPKVKSWMAVLLQEGEMDDLIRMNLDEFILFLKNRVKKVDFNPSDIIAAEGLLKQEALFFLHSGKRFLGGSTKTFIDAWSNIFEIENLKLTIRAIINGKPLTFLYQLGSNNKFQLEFLKDIKTLDDLQE